MSKVVAAVVIGMLYTTAAAVLWVADARGVYWSEVRVMFLAPQNGMPVNAFIATPDSLITTAGVVAKKVGASFDAPAVVSDTVTLPGEGVDDGWSVRLPNTGGQWATNFASAAVVVQAVGPSVQRVEATIAEALSLVAEALRSLEAESGVDPQNAIALRLNPEVPVVLHLAGSAKRAVLATAAIGLGATWAAASTVARRLPAVLAPRRPRAAAGAA